MKMDLAGAMRAATKLTRAQKLIEATRIIQSALLLGRGPTEPDQEQAHDRGRPEADADPGDDGAKSHRGRTGAITREACRRSWR